MTLVYLYQVNRCGHHRKLSIAKLDKSADWRWISITILCVSFTNSATAGRLETSPNFCNRLIDQSADNITGLKCAKECLILKSISISRILDITRLRMICTTYFDTHTRTKTHHAYCALGFFALNAHFMLFLDLKPVIRFYINFRPIRWKHSCLPSDNIRYLLHSLYSDMD